MRNSIGIGLLGSGGRIRGLANRVTEKEPSTQVVAISDPLESSLNAGLEELNPNAKIYRDHRELVQDSDVDWVMVGSWNSMHREHVVTAFEAGKHVFCEKPLATTLDDCLAMREAWQESGRQFIIGFTLRYSPHYNRIKEVVDEGQIGRIISLEFNETLNFNHGGYIMGDWRRLRAYAGTHLLEKCCHDIDLANWIVNSTAKHAASFGGLDFFVPENESHIERLGQNENGKEAYRTWSSTVQKNPFTSDKDIIDNQVAILEYTNRVRATFHTNCNAGIPERRMYICGTEGAIRGDLLGGKLEFQRIGFNEEIQDLSTSGKGGHGGGDDPLIQNIADCMAGRSTPRTSLEDGLRSAITCFAVDEAMDTGKVVDLTPLWQQAEIPME